MRALKITASDVFLIGSYFLSEKNRMTVHVEMCTKHFGLKSWLRSWRLVPYSAPSPDLFAVWCRIERWLRGFNDCKEVLNHAIEQLNAFKGTGEMLV